MGSTWTFLKKGTAMSSCFEMTFKRSSTGISQKKKHSTMLGKTNIPVYNIYLELYYDHLFTDIY